MNMLFTYWIIVTRECHLEQSAKEPCCYIIIIIIQMSRIHWQLFQDALADTTYGTYQEWELYPANHCSLVSCLEPEELLDSISKYSKGSLD